MDCLTLPSNLKQLGVSYYYTQHMFYNFGTENFSAFNISEDNQYYKTINGLLYTKDGKSLISVPKGAKFDNNAHVMPDSVEILGELCFSRNKNIDVIVISDNLVVNDSLTEEEMEYNNHGNDLSRACYGYTNIARYEVKPSNQRYVSVNGILYTKDMTTLVAIPNNYVGDIVVPEGVTTWQDEALWADMIDYFDGIAFREITGIYLTDSLINIPESQKEGINKLVEKYGVKYERLDN